MKGRLAIGEDIIYLLNIFVSEDSRENIRREESEKKKISWELLGRYSLLNELG
jgi:hypothetical protein